MLSRDRPGAFRLGHVRSRIIGLGLVVALLTAIGIVGLAGPASATPTFQMPFPCGETWYASTYTNHYSYAGTGNPYPLDWNLTVEDGGKPVLAGVSGTATVGYD